MYQYKELYTIDFRKVEHYLEMHIEICKALDWPEYYGCNWDAFWDCLINMLGRPIHIEILGFDVVERKFGDAAKTMIETLKEFKHHDSQYVNEIIIEIVSENTRMRIE